MRLAAGRVCLIGRQRGVTINQVDAVEGNGKFFGHQLGLCGRNALAQLFLAAIRRHSPVGGDGDPGIELIDWR
jgi:hypothetical protein